MYVYVFMFFISSCWNGTADLHEILYENLICTIMSKCVYIYRAKRENYLPKINFGSFMFLYKQVHIVVLVIERDNFCIQIIGLQCFFYCLRAWFLAEHHFWRDIGQ